MRYWGGGHIRVYEVLGGGGGGHIKAYEVLGGGGGGHMRYCHHYIMSSFHYITT